MNKNSMLFVGLDLGDKHSHLTIFDQDGPLIEESRLPTTKAALRRKFASQPASLQADHGGRRPLPPGQPNSPRTQRYGAAGPVSLSEL